MTLRLPFSAIPLGFPLRRNWLYWLDVEFANAQVAPIATYDGEVGRLDFTDTSSVFSVSTGKLRWSSSGSFLASSFLSEQPLTPLGGLTLKAALNIGTRAQIDWTEGTDLAVGRRFGIDQNSTSLNAIIMRSDNTNGQVTTGKVVVAGTDYQLAVVVRPSGGAFWFIKGGIYTNWTLAWFDDIYVAATLAAEFSATSGAGTMDFIRVAQLGSPLNADHDIATLYQSNPVSGTVYSGAANGINRVSGIVLPASPSANQIALQLRYNVLDSNNYNVIYLQRNAGNTAWDAHLATVAAGVLTNRLNATGIGAVNDFRAVHNGSLHNMVSKVNGSNTSNLAQVNNANQSTQSSVSVVLNGATCTLLDVYPQDNAAYAALDNI